MSAALAQRENRADLAGGLRLPSVSPEVQRILISLMRQETRAGANRLARLAVRELGEEVQLLPNTAMDVPLYWAHPRTAQVALERLTQCVMAAARQWLEPPLAA